MPILRFAPGVTVGDPPTACQTRILAALDGAAGLLRHDLTVTCGREGHPLTDPHTRGLALDVRVQDLSEAQILALVDAVQQRLGAAFTVLYEIPVRPVGVLASIAYVNANATGPHCHVQLRKGLDETAWLAREQVVTT